MMCVANIVQAHHLKLQITEVEGELVTPTGAAIVAAIKTSEKMPAQFEIGKTGIGAGKREYSRPSMLRLMLIKDTSKETVDSNCNSENFVDDLHNVSTRHGDGWQGWQARAPFDAIIVTAAPPEIPTALMTQLDEGGILVLPVGEEHQYLKRVRRRGGEFIIDTVEAVRFVPLVKGELA